MLRPRPGDCRLRTVLTVAVIAILATGPFAQRENERPGRDFPARDWPYVGGDWSGSRYSTLAGITRENVGRLQGAWTVRLDGGASSRATAVIEGGRIFLTGAASVFAIDGLTGRTIWRWQAERPGMVPSWQGAGLGGGLVFVGTSSAQVAALDQETGNLAWLASVGSEPRQAGETVTSAPIHADGRVFVGLANGDSGGQGAVIALDAKTGKMLWRFSVVPRPGEFGHETWPQDSDAWKLGGGGVWLPGTIDPELGLVYFATGNPVPMFGGEIRRGDNLFTASILALEMETGKRRWHYQVVRHDIWDADIATPLVLYEAQVEGRPRKALAAMRADGYLFAFDRQTGESLAPIEDRPVPQDPFQHTAPTQPFPVGVESILHDCEYWRGKVPSPFQLSCSGFTPPSVDQQTVVAPGVPIPRVRVTPMAYSPQTGYLFAQGHAMVGRARRFADPWLSNAGGYQLTLPDPIGVIAAVDTRSGKLAWRKEVPSELLGTSGPLATAGGLVFRGAPDGLVEALEARTGERVWAFQTSAPGTRVRPGPAAAYEINGRQFIAIPMGPYLWAFTLDGGIAAAAPALAEDDARRGVAPAGPAPRDTTEIETATYIENPSWSIGGRRVAVDEHAFNPVRARVKAGTRVRFLNNGEMTHAVAARDGSWTTRPLEPARWDYVTFDRPGTFLYHCPEHPWAIGEITVDPQE